MTALICIVLFLLGLTIGFIGTMVLAEKVFRHHRLLIDRLTQHVEHVASHTEDGRVDARQVVDDLRRLKGAMS